MKKIFFSLAAVLVFSAAQAQTAPQQVPPAKQVPTAPGVIDNGTNKSTTIKPDAVSKQDADGTTTGTQPRKDQLKTNDHVKSTPVKTAGDTVATKKSKRTTRVQ